MNVASSSMPITPPSCPISNHAGSDPVDVRSSRVPFGICTSGTWSRLVTNGAAVSGRVVDPDADAHRTRERLHHRRHDDRRIVVGEQRDPPHVADVRPAGGPSAVVDEVEQRSSLVGIRQHVLQAVRVARPAGRVAEPGGVRPGRGRQSEGSREVAERAEIVLGDGHR